MQNNPKAFIFVINLHTIFAKQIKSLQKTFANTFACQKAQHHEAIKSLKKEIEEICKNPLFVTSSSQLDSIDIDPQALGRKNISKTGFSTPNLLTKAPAKKLTECLFDPPTYFGKKNKLCSFINQLYNKLKGNKDHYTDTDSWWCYVIGLLKGDAAETIYPFQPDTVEDIVIILKAFYGDPNQVATA